MAKRITSDNPDSNIKDDNEGEFQEEFDNFTEQVLHNPNVIASFQDINPQLRG